MTAGFRNQIDVTLCLADEVIGHVDIKPRTRPPLGRLFAGRPVEALLATVPRLFSLCATAHQVALLSALEAARGEQAAATTRHRRIKAVVAERLTELLRGLLPGPLTRDRAAAQQLLQAVTGLQGRSGSDGLAPFSSEVLSQIKMALAAPGIGLGPVVPGTRPASMMAQAREASGDRGWRHMPVELCYLSAADDEAIVSRLMVAGTAFAEAPELNGRIPETGVWARYVAQAGPELDGPFERLSAKISEIAALVCWIEAGEGEDAASDEGLVASYALGPRRGAAAVECARGRLHYAIELDGDGHIAHFEFLAPTEWNFHPYGPVAKRLTGAARPRCAADHAAIEAMIGCFDPCVGYRVAVREMADA
ncbi:hydrogenase assembly protein HupF [Bradyrhizobium oligotrophicum]|uniref:hydrogenase assembly protein HupF n=1 Tax=Bradyrhizobium oligotrophicum TaxID=44255 RepID=UPI003EB85BFB